MQLIKKSRNKKWQRSSNQNKLRLQINVTELMNNKLDGGNKLKTDNIEI